MNVPKIVVTFKLTEKELYEKLRKLSSPAAYLKDLAKKELDK